MKVSHFRCPVAKHAAFVFVLFWDGKPFFISAIMIPDHRAPAVPTTIPSGEGNDSTVAVGRIPSDLHWLPTTLDTKLTI